MLFDFAVRPPTSAEVEVVRKWIEAGAPAAPKQAVIAEDATDPLVSDEDASSGRSNLRSGLKFRSPSPGTGSEQLLTLSFCKSWRPRT
jgi:hypothetical protein